MAHLKEWSEEISDRIVCFEPETRERLPVRRAEVIDYFQGCGNRRAAAIVARMPEHNGELVPAFVDDTLLCSHVELQRLHEEFLHGYRVLELLGPLFGAFAAAGIPKPWHVVDIGCGLGFTVRWLAAYGNLRDVRLTGVDYNTHLIDHARRWSEREGLDCEFLAANAFQLQTPATVYLSTGVVHHFRGPGLQSFFAQQAERRPAAIVHFDIKPSWLAPLGSWMFHRARMRVPLARHDGVLSTMRAYPGPDLLAAVRAAAPDYQASLFDGHVGLVPLLRIFQAVVGVVPALYEPFVAEMSRSGRAHRLGELG